jgi:hypothetical protein
MFAFASMRFIVLAFLASSLACQQSVPAGIEPITVYVVDAVSGAALCTADVTINQTPMTAGGGNAIGCYFVPSTTLSAGQAYTLGVSQTGYVSQTETGTIAADGSTVLVQLVPTDGDDGGSDATVDAPSEASIDASSSDASDASDAATE